jgi:alanyl-tRNA synthetase
VALVREHDRTLEALATRLQVTPIAVLDAVDAREAQRKQLESQVRKAAAETNYDAAAIAATAVMLDGVPVLSSRLDLDDPKALADAADHVKGKLGTDGVVVLASASDGRASMVVSVAPSIVARGVRAGEIAKVAAEVLGGGGGGRDTLAQAGGSEVAKLDEALAAAATAVQKALNG